MKRLLPWLFVLILVGIGGLALYRWVAAQVNADQQHLQAVAGAVSSATATPEIISAERLFDPNLDPQSRQSLSEKLDINARKAADQATGAENSAPKDKLPPMPTSQPQALANSGALTGIFNGSEGMVKPEQAKINNYWQGMLDGKSTMIMAGSPPEDTSTGLVIVVSSDGFSVTGYQVIAAPAGVSSLKVVDFSTTTLVLEDLSGTQITFDLQTQSFIR